MTKPLTAGADNFAQVILKSERPALVDFWAPWCAPCRAVAPIIEELAKEYDNKITVAKVNVDENPSLAASYGIQSIPTLLLFKNGKPLRQVVGLRTKQELKQILDAVLP